MSEHDRALADALAAGDIEAVRRLNAERRREQVERLEADLAALREAAQAVVEEGCREELGKPTFDKCWKPAEFVLWGKLIPPEGLGPRCYEHAVKHVHHSMLSRTHGLKLEAAIIDLRPLRAVLASADSESREETP